jgi:CRP/FNR family transcriptional regulator
MSDTESWIGRFPGLSKLEDKVRASLLAHSRVVDVPAGSVIFGPGKAPENLLLLLEGTVRVQQVSESGREIVLYRVSAGESCVLTTACLLAYEDYLAEGVAETDIVAVALPRATFDDLIAHSAVFRQFVFTAFSSRITDLFRVIDDVAFSHIDIRLAQRLLQIANGQRHVAATHQDLANELGSARQVISRQLKEFQRRGWIETTRGSIALVNRPALEKLSAER